MYTVLNKGAWQSIQLNRGAWQGDFFVVYGLEFGINS